MSSVQILRIVVASPGDVQAERDALTTVVEEINRGIAGDRSLWLELSRWETDAYPGFHPEGSQGLIDSVLNIQDCDVLIGIFWKRFGTPVKDAGSGTEHEFLRAHEAWRAQGRPQIMVYFNQRPYTPKSKAEIDQWGQVLEFQERFPKEGLWWPYKGKVQFEKLVRGHLTHFIRHQTLPASTPSQNPAVPVTSASVNQSGGDPGRPALTKGDFEHILKKYLAWVGKAYNKARLYGLESLPAAQSRPVRELSEVFVPLTLRRVRPSHREEVEALATERQVSAAQAYFQLAQAKQREGNIVSLRKLLTMKDKLAVIGGAGTGKSTLIAYFAASLANTEERSPLALPRGKATLVPLVIPLRYCRDYLRLCKESPQERLRSPRTGTLAGFIPWYLKRRSPALETSEDFFDRLLLGGGCLLMLDGLDEVVSRADRSWVRQQVEEIVNDVYPGNQVLVTAREAGYREDAVFGDDFLRLDVQPLDDDQIRALVAKWCGQLYPDEVDRRTGELVEAIQNINNLRANRDLPPLVSTPLMTTMVVSVKWGETDLPRERAKLYEACVKVILQAQYIPDDPARKELVEWGGPWEEQRDWLATLALAMHEGGRAGAAAPEARVREVLRQELSPADLEQFLEAVRHRGGLFEEKAELFQFVHLTFQEFLAARWLAKRRREAFPHLQHHLADPWWREVLLLTYGFAQADHPPSAREYLDWLSSQTDDGEDRLAGLELAGSALLELERPNPEIRQQQAERLTKALQDRTLSTTGILRARAGNTLARLSDPRFRANAWYLPDEPMLGFVEVPGGIFLMGSDPKRDKSASKDERPQREIYLPRYYIARYPVTVAQFRAFVEDSTVTNRRMKTAGKISRTIRSSMSLGTRRSSTATG